MFGLCVLFYGHFLLTFSGFSVIYWKYPCTTKLRIWPKWRVKATQDFYKCSFLQFLRMAKRGITSVEASSHRLEEKNYIYTAQNTEIKTKDSEIQIKLRHIWKDTLKGLVQQMIKKTTTYHLIYPTTVEANGISCVVLTALKESYFKKLIETCLSRNTVFFTLDNQQISLELS